jgi:hypothetical protein
MKELQPALTQEGNLAVTTRIERRKRGIIGWIFLLLFWGFNALMAFSFVAGLSGTAESYATMGTEAERAGHAIGTMIGGGMILGIWAMGALILGLFVFLTRGDKVIVETRDS